MLTVQLRVSDDQRLFDKLLDLATSYAKGLALPCSFTWGFYVITIPPDLSNEDRSVISSAVRNHSPRVAATLSPYIEVTEDAY